MTEPPVVPASVQVTLALLDSGPGPSALPAAVYGPDHRLVIVAGARGEHLVRALHEPDGQGAELAVSRHPAPAPGPELAANLVDWVLTAAEQLAADGIGLHAVSVDLVGGGNEERRSAELRRTLADCADTLAGTLAGIRVLAPARSAAGSGKPVTGTARSRAPGRAGHSATLALPWLLAALILVLVGGRLLAG